MSLRLVIKAEQLPLVFGPRKPVERPGSRGGQFWIDRQGRVRYDDRPAGRIVTAREAFDSGALTATDQQPPDPRPGPYFVTAIDAGRNYWMAGPYRRHQDALDAVERARGIAHENDTSGRAWFMAWGTARAPERTAPGRLTALGLMPDQDEPLRLCDGCDHEQERVGDYEAIFRDGTRGPVSYCQNCASVALAGEGDQVLGIGPLDVAKAEQLHAEYHK